MNRTDPQLNPTLYYRPAPSSLAAYNPFSVESIMRQIVDKDRYADVGRAMKIRCEFVEMCSTFMPDFCKIVGRKAVVKQALKWSLNDNNNNADHCGPRELSLRLKWRRKIADHVQNNDEYSESASELIFQMIDDDGLMEKASVDLKQKMALCLIYAIWKERREDSVFGEPHFVDAFFNEQPPFYRFYEQEKDMSPPPQIYDPNMTFADFIKSGKTHFTENISPWVAFNWVFKNAAIGSIFDLSLKKKVEKYIKLPNLINIEKRINENSFLLNMLGVDLLTHYYDDETRTTEKPSKELEDLKSNIVGVHDWGLCLDKTFLSQKTVSRFANELLNDQNDLIQGLLKVEKKVVSAGISEACDSLQREFLKRVTPMYVAEGVVPLFFTFFIRSKMLYLNQRYSLPQLRDITRYLINGLSPIIFASTALAAFKLNESDFANFYVYKTKQAQISPQLPQTPPQTQKEKRLSSKRVSGKL